MDNHSSNRVQIEQLTLQGIEFYRGTITKDGITIHQTTRMSEAACRQALAKYLWQVKRTLYAHIGDKV